MKRIFEATLVVFVPAAEGCKQGCDYDGGAALY
jgi:hypothetical protein